MINATLKNPLRVALMILAVLTISLSVGAEPKLSIEVLDSSKIGRLSVVPDNSYYDDFLFIETEPVLKQGYSIVLSDSEGNTQELLVDLDGATTIFETDIESIQLMHNGTRVDERRVSFCNNNNICEPCDTETCTLVETYISCSDCPTGEKDQLCDMVKDDVCDPDCASGYDCEDCKTQCSSDLLRDPDESINIPEHSDGAEFIPEEEPRVPIEEIFQSSPGFSPISRSSYASIIGVGIGLFVILLVVALLSTRKTKGEVLIQNLQQEIHGLISGGYNYVQIKQYLVQKGHHPEHVDGAIRKHYNDRIAPQQRSIAPILAILGLLSLVALFFLLPHTITGLQAAETDADKTSTVDTGETEMVLGINPSFHISVKYDIAFYTTVGDNVKTLEECQANIACMLEKVAAFDSDEVNWIVEFNGAILTNLSDGTPESELWVTHCESIEEFASNTFTENLEFCATSIIDGCICNVSIPSETMEYPPYSDSLWKDFEIELTAQQASAGFDQSQEETSTTGALLYVDDGGIELADGYTFSYEAFSEAGRLVFYRNNSNMVILVEPDELSKYEGVRPCEKLKITPRFCVINKNNVLPIYDLDTEEIEDTPLVVKFAYTFEKKLTNVQGVNLTDLALAEDAVVISWDALPPEQVESYTVYYGTEDFEGLHVKDLLEDETLSQQIGVEINTTGSLNITDAVKFNSLDAGPVCVLDDNQVCVPTYTVTAYVSEEYGDYPEGTTAELTRGILYYLSLDDRYFTILPVPDITSSGDTQEWYFGVIAEDPEGETTEGFGVPEIKVKETALITRIGTGTGKSWDDLPPGIPHFTVVNTTYDSGTATFTIINVTTNIDGSPSDDLGEYVFYCGQGYLESGDTLYPLESAWLSSLPISEVTTAQFEHNISMAIITDAPECGLDHELHRFIVIASDQQFASDILAFSKANSYNGSVTAKGYSS